MVAELNLLPFMYINRGVLNHAPVPVPVPVDVAFVTTKEPGRRTKVSKAAVAIT